MDNNLKKFHNARFLEKISVVVLGLILLTSMVPLQSVIAGAAIDFDQEGNLSNTASASTTPQIATSPDGVYVLWQDGAKIFFGDITNSGANPNTVPNIGDAILGNPQLSTLGDNVYSVWRDGIIPSDIKFIPSGDATPDPNDVLTVSNSPSVLSTSPHTAASGSNVFVTWQESLSGNDDILFRVYSEISGNFAAIFPLGNTASPEAKPQVASFDSDVYVVWSGKSGTSKAISFVSNGNNGNGVWSSPQDLASGGTAKNPQIKASDNDVYVSWWEDGDIKFRIRDSLGNWNPPLTEPPNNLGDSESASTTRMAMSSSGDVYVVWRDENGGIGDIKFRIRDSLGNWSPPLEELPHNLSSSPGDSAEPHIAASGEDVYVVWSDKTNDKDDGWDILYKASDNNGGSFGPGCGEPIRVDPDIESTDPHVAVSGTDVFVVWKDNETGNSDILFKAGGPTNVFEFDKCQIRLGGSAQISYTDVSLATEETFIIDKIASTSDPDSIELFTLFADPPGSGTFVGVLTLGEATDPAENTIEANAGDKIEATVGGRTIFAHVFPPSLQVRQISTNSVIDKFDFGDFAKVVVEDQNANLDETAIDQVVVDITSLVAGDATTLTLLETGPDTGIFGESSELIFPIGEGGDALSIGSKFTVTQNRTLAPFGLDAGAIDTIENVQVFSTSDPIGRTISLTETGVDTKFFTNPNVLLGDSIPDVFFGTIGINVKAGDILSVSTADYTVNYLVVPNSNPSLGAIVVGEQGTNEKVTVAYEGLSVEFDVEDTDLLGGGGGGLVRPGLVVNALGFVAILTSGLAGGGSSGPTAPTITSSSIIGEPGPSFMQLGEGSGSGGTTMLMSLDDSSGPQTLQTGQNYQFEFELYENQGIGNLEHATMYFFPEDYVVPQFGIDLSQSYAHILYDVGKSAHVIDPHGYIASAVFEISKKDAWNLILKYDITFAKEMGTTSLLIRTWDLDRNVSDKKLIHAIKVVDSSILQASLLEDSTPNIVQTELQDIPIWVKNNAAWWYEKQIDDSDFVSGIEYLINKNIINIPDTSVSNSVNSQEIPTWIRDVAGFWAHDSISDAEFIQAFQWLINNGVMVII